MAAASRQGCTTRRSLTCAVDVVALPEVLTARSTRPRARTTACLTNIRSGLRDGRRLALHPSLRRSSRQPIRPGCLGPSGDGLAMTSSSWLSSPPRSTAGPRPCPPASSPPSASLHPRAPPRVDDRPTFRHGRYRPTHRHRCSGRVNSSTSERRRSNAKRFRLRSKNCVVQWIGLGVVVVAFRVLGSSPRVPGSFTGSSPGRSKLDLAGDDVVYV